MRVLLVAGTFPPEPCGVGDYIGRLATAIADLPEFSVGVLTSGRASQNIPGVELLVPASDWSWGSLQSALDSVKKWKPDLVHIHYPSQGFYGRTMPSMFPLACRLSGYQVVQTWHEAYGITGAVHCITQALGANGLIFVRPNYWELLSSVLRPFARRVPSVIIPSAGALPKSGLSREHLSELKHKYLKGQQRLVVFFGFVYPQKGVEQLFEIADPASDSLVIAGACKDESYLLQLQQTALENGWGDQWRLLGFVDVNAAADLLAAADAVVLPFLQGGGSWNTSIHGARAQGTLVITTSTTQRGDDAEQNMHVSAPSDVADMRSALSRLSGRKVAGMETATQWMRIARSHVDFYRQVLGSRRPKNDA